ncbi:MAG: hypothetical protein ABSE54_02885 [Smithella sp.]
MKINCRQTIVKLLFPDKKFLAFLVAVAFFIMSSPVCFAPTKEVMSDLELSNVEGQALINVVESSNVNGSTDVIRVNMGIDLNLQAYVGSMKLGYYNNGTSTDWDENITNLFLGSVDRSSSLVLSGLYLEVGFDNLGNDATRKLNYIEFGTNSATGSVTGTMNTVSSLMAGNGGSNTGVVTRLADGSTKTITFNNESLSFLFTSKFNYSTSSNLSGIFIKMPSNTGT